MPETEATVVTVAERWGPEIANDLAMLAIDLLLEPPTVISTFATKIPTHRIVSGRDILDRAGFDWRAFKAEKHGGRNAHAARRGA